MISPASAVRPLPALRAGAATIDITPTRSLFLYGYPHVARDSTGTHDPLESSALFLDDGHRSVLFLANDVINFPTSYLTDVRRRIATATGVPADAILVSATHTHSGPMLVNQISNAADPVVPGVDETYLAWLAERLVAVASAAVAAAQPAKAGLLCARVEGVGSNRHNPEGISDPDVPVLLVRSQATAVPIACLLVYGMHPTVLHEDSTLYSADFPGFARRWLQRGVLPAGCPVLYHNGASGDQSPRHMTRANTFAEAQRLGEILGRCVATVIPKIICRSDLAIAVGTTRLALVPRALPTETDAVVAAAKAKSRFTDLKKSGASRQAVRTAECDVFGADESVELARAVADGRVDAAIARCSPAEIQVLQIGPWKFAAWPGEFFAKFALNLKAAHPDTFVITLANGELQGYIVTAEAAAHKVYEAGNALFAPENGPAFVAATGQLIDSLR